MAMRECCDAYGTPKGVGKYTVMISRGEIDPLGDAFANVVSTKHGSLCEKGFKRAEGFIGQSFTAVSRTPADVKAKPDAS